jgi:hypothetical protein
VPKQQTISRADLSPCSWLYLEVNAHDGRDLDGFFTNGNRYFEEVLRAELSPARAFCAAALESDPAHAEALLAVRADKARFTRRFNVFAGISARPGAPASPSTVQLPDLVHQLTFSRAESGVAEHRRMPTALANGQNGTTIVRISGIVEEILHYFDALDSSGVLCDRIDRLVLNITSDVRDIMHPPHARAPSALASSSAPDLARLVELAKGYEARAACRTRLFITDTDGVMIAPLPIKPEAVFYAVLAGAPTFNKRVDAQTGSWMQGVPLNRVALFTNVERTPEDSIAARGRDVVVAQPHDPSLEKALVKMQSWSHLVRLRESWDRFMRDDPSIKWLALVDDDTFVFPAGMREYLTMLDPRLPVWGGSAEQARIDNGDHGEFALWLRNLSVAHGGDHCYMANEEVPTDMQGVRVEILNSSVMNGRKISKKVSHMCHDNFCRKGCPAVPQGATIVVSRAMVEAIRPAVELCEAATSSLCERCGSQRLFMCVNRYVANPRTIMTRGVCRSTWKMEHRDNFLHALSYHAFDRYGHRSLSTNSIHDDMAELWNLGKVLEGSDIKPWHQTVPMQAIGDLLGCGGSARYIKGSTECEPYGDDETAIKAVPPQVDGAP